MKMTKHLPARRTLIAGLVGLVVGLGIAGGAWWYLDHQSTAQAATPTTISRTVAASVDTIKKTISTTGTLTPAVQQDVSFVASGNVTAVNVTAGQQVTAGQPLATVDTLTMQQTLASANLTLAKAQATLVNDQTALSTAQDAQTTAADAGDDTTAADAKVATAQQQITVDQTSITTAQAAVDTAQTALNSATLLAPIDGIVSTVNVTVGQKITGTAAASSSAAGSSLDRGEWRDGQHGRDRQGRRLVGVVGRLGQCVEHLEYCRFRDRQHQLLEGRRDGRRCPDRPDLRRRSGATRRDELDRSAVRHDLLDRADLDGQRRYRQLPGRGHRDRHSDRSA